MGIREPAVAQIASFAKFAVMAIGAVDVTAVQLLRARARPCFVFEDELLARAETLAVVVVAVFTRLTYGKKGILAPNLSKQTLPDLGV